MTRMPPAVQDVWDGVRSEPARVLVSVFAISVGVVVLVILLAFLAGLKERARVLVAELGANVVAVFPDRDEESERPVRLTEEDARLLAANLPDCRVSLLRENILPSSPALKGISVLATDENLARVRGWSMRAGRFIDRQDMTAGDRHAVISGDLADARKWVVGSVVPVANVPFRIVGIVDVLGGAVEREGGDARLAAGTRAVFVPATAALPVLERSREESRWVDVIFLQAPLSADLPSVLGEAKRILSKGRVGGASELEWVTPELLIRGVRRLQKAVRLAGGSIAFLCIVLGGTALMSLMVANVRDRVPEIGLRRALGATPADIAGLFVLESFFVTGVSALTGLGTSVLILGMVRRRLEMTVEAGAGTFALALLVSVAAGAAFSYWPARMASRIAPSEALRND